MYHPTRGGVRGGRDQFSWDDVKADKHRENYLGHSIKAPVGRWQKGKDLNWYSRDKKTLSAEMDAAKEEIKRIKEEEDQAMREALGLAPKRANRAQGNRLDKHELSELVKRGSTAEDLGEGHAEAAHVHGLGFSSLQSRGVQVYLKWKIFLCLNFHQKKTLKRGPRMKAVKGKGGVKRGSTRNKRGVRNVRSMKNGIRQTKGNIGKTRRRGDMLRTLNKCFSFKSLWDPSEPSNGYDPLLVVNLILTVSSASILYESISEVHLMQ